MVTRAGAARLIAVRAPMVGAGSGVARVGIILCRRIGGAWIDRSTSAGNEPPAEWDS